MTALSVDLDALTALAEAAVEIGYDDPWRWGKEPREHHRRALKSGPHTVLTVGRYYDGGSDEQDAALSFIAAANPAVVAALVRAVRAAQEIRTNFPFLNGVPGMDYGGSWIEFVEALAPFAGEEAE